MTVEIGSAGGHLAEMGWGNAEDGGPVHRAAGSATLLVVASTYWGFVWLLSGLAPFAYLATHIRRGLTARAKPERASALSEAPAAVLQAERMTQSASSLSVATSDAER